MHRTALATAATSAGLAAGAALLLAAPAVAQGSSVRSTGDLVRYVSDSPLLPDDAAARVHYTSTGDDRTRVTLHLTGFAPGHVYGAHAHVLPCWDHQGGGHFQADSTRGVNPANEIWLDVETNRAGNGHSVAVQDWPIEPGSGPQSVIIHARATQPGTGLAGTKLACVDVAV